MSPTRRTLGRRGYRSDAAAAELEAEKFNRTMPVGTAVRYWGVARDIGFANLAIETRTSSTAFVMGGHTACVRLEKVSGYVACSHVRPLAEASS